MRFLAQVVSTKRPTSNGRRQREIADYVFCLLVPVVLVALHTLTAPARYGIAQGLGCTNTWTLSWVTYVSYIVWLPLLSFVGCLYSGKAQRNMVADRSDTFCSVYNSSPCLASAGIQQDGQPFAFSSHHFSVATPVSTGSCIHLFQYRSVDCQRSKHHPGCQWLHRL